ncbi:MAG TPA: hypothetical protein VF889_00685 [Bacteroidota bacterium]
MSAIRTIHGFLTALACAGLVLCMLPGCGKKEVQPMPVGDMTEYRDPGYGFRFSYPKGWQINAEVGRAVTYSAPDVDKRFLDPEGAYPDGALISVTLTKGPQPMGSADSTISQMKAAGFQVQGPQQVTVADKPATRYTYAGRFTAGTQTGEHIYLPLDTVLYDIWFAGFGDYYTQYQNVFAASLKSFQLPRPVAKGADETLPSETYVEGENKYATFMYPENFNFSNPAKGTFEMSQELHGYRQDCSIRFDVFDAKGQALEKVFDQNKGKYRAAGTGKATIGGEPAMYVAYNPTKDVTSRAYFLVHKGKAFRITENMYRPQEKEYMAAFEKLLGSLKWK